MADRPKTSRILPVDLSAASATLWLTVTAFLALLALYVIGVDQSAVSHEFVHDARHLLGFPCH